jgi:hypothetical protein
LLHQELYELGRKLQLQPSAWREGPPWLRRSEHDQGRRRRRGRRQLPQGRGFPAVEGWYGTNVGPHLTESPAAANFVKTFQEKYHSTPDDYSITA